MSPKVHPVSIRLGKHSTLLWGRQPTSFFFNFNSTKFSLLLVKFLLHVFYKKKIQLVDFIFNQATTVSKLLLIVHRLVYKKKRYHVPAGSFFSFFFFSKKKKSRRMHAERLKFLPIRFFFKIYFSFFKTRRIFSKAKISFFKRFNNWRKRRLQPLLRKGANYNINKSLSFFYTKFLFKKKINYSKKRRLLRKLHNNSIDLVNSRYRLLRSVKHRYCSTSNNKKGSFNKEYGLKNFFLANTGMVGIGSKLRLNFSELKNIIMSKYAVNLFNFLFFKYCNKRNYCTSQRASNFSIKFNLFNTCKTLSSFNDFTVDNSLFKNFSLFIKNTRDKKKIIYLFIKVLKKLFFLRKFNLIYRFVSPMLTNENNVASKKNMHLLTKVLIFLLRKNPLNVFFCKYQSLNYTRVKLLLSLSKSYIINTKLLYYTRLFKFLSNLLHNKVKKRNLFLLLLKKYNSRALLKRRTKRTKPTVDNFKKFSYRLRAINRLTSYTKNLYFLRKSKHSLRYLKSFFKSRFFLRPFRRLSLRDTKFNFLKMFNVKFNLTFFLNYFNADLITRKNTLIFVDRFFLIPAATKISSLQLTKNKSYIIKFFFLLLSTNFGLQSNRFYHRKIRVYIRRINFFIKRQQILFFELFLSRIFKKAFNVSMWPGLSLLKRKFTKDLRIGTAVIFKRAHIHKRAFHFCRNFINLFYLSIKFCTLTGLITFFCNEFYYRKRQQIFLNAIARVLNFIEIKKLHFIGFSMLVSGKLKRRPRARKFFLRRGEKPRLSLLDLKVQYCSKQVISSFGVYGIRMWLYYL